MIDENRIKRTIESFSFPRLSGTKHEEKALNMIFEKLTNLNIEPKVQEFEFSIFFGRIYPKIGFFSGFILILFFFFKIESIIIVIISFIITLVLVLAFIITRKPENIRLRNMLPSANIYVKLPSNAYKLERHEFKEKNIIFFSHLDSKGQKFTILVRIRAIRAWVFSSLVLFALIVLKNYIFIFTNFTWLFYAIGAVPFILNSFATILLILNSTNNLSPGAIDDASGIACVFELLNHFLESKSRLRHLNLIFVFTGAEECGTMGIRYFEKLSRDFDKNSTIFFNFDAIAQNIYLFPGKKPSNEVKVLYNSFLQNKRDLIIKNNPKKFYFGSHSDGYYMKKKGYNGIGIGDMDSYNFIHSTDDTPNQINCSLLKDLCANIAEILEAMDKQL